MASPPLQSRYKRYKQLNQEFETWLLDAARNRKQCCDDALHIPDKLNTTQFLHFTKYVCSAGAPPLVRPEIVETVAEVVYLRRQAMECYAALAWQEPELTDDTTLLSNQTHRHFFKILQQVLSLLRSALSSTNPQKCRANDKSGASSTPKAGNFFAQLPVEEPSTYPMGQEATVAQNGDSNPAIEAANADGSNEEAEKEFAIICFFQDARDIRRHLLGVWKRFYQGKISFAVAEHVTEVAFCMLSDLDRALRSNYDDLWSIDQIYKSLHLNVDQFGGEASRVFSKVFRDDEPEAADLYCIAGWCTVYEFESLCAARRNSEVKQPEKSYFYGHPFAQELLRLQPDIQKLANSFGNSGPSKFSGLYWDRFTQSLVEACRFSHIWTCLVIQCQVMLDIYDALGGICSFAYVDLRCAARQTIESFDNFYSSFPQNGESGKVNTPLHDHLGVILKDKYFAPSRNGHKQKPSTILKSLPLLSGRNLSEYYQLGYMCAQSLMNQSPIMLSAAYLYKAVKMASDTDVSWPGMDFVIAKQSKRSAYVRDADDAEGYARLFDIALGNPASKFARGATNKSQPRPVSKNNLKNARKLEAMPSDIIARKKLESMSRTKRNYTNEFYAQLYFTVHDAEKSDRVPKTHEPLPLLADLEKAYSSDEAELTFDYLTVAAQSNYLLHSVAEFVQSQVEGMDFLTRTDPHEVVRFIFRLATQQPIDSTQNPILCQPAISQVTILSQIGLRFNKILAECPAQLSVPTTSRKPCERWKWGTRHEPVPPTGWFAQVENELRLRHLNLTETSKKAENERSDGMFQNIESLAPQVRSKRDLQTRPTARRAKIAQLLQAMA